MIPFVASTTTQLFGSSANNMRCLRFQPQTQMSSLTKLAMELTTGAAGASVGIAIYNDGSAGSRLATTGALSAGTGDVGVIKATGLSSFTMNVGTFYQFCHCSTSTATAFRAMLDTSAGGQTDMLNAGTVQYGTAANNCAAGVPPTTTGVLTGVVNRSAPLGMVAK